MDGDFACSFCGEDVGEAGERYLVARSGWDRLRVMHWMPEQEADALTACSPDHAMQLVGQWLVTGDLMAPFARAVLGEQPGELTEMIFTDPERETICELAVDRASMEMVLAESPQFLDTMLSALCEAVSGESRTGFVNDGQPAQTSGAMAAD